MPRVYFEGWYDGVFAKAEDWYKDGVIYVNLKHYRPGAALSCPTKECSFWFGRMRRNALNTIRTVS